MRQMLVNLLSYRSLCSFFGVTVLSVLIWFLGPQLLLGETYWFASRLNRQVAIGIGYLMWIIFQLIPQMYHAWFNNKLLARLQNDNIDSAVQLATEELLHMRFNEALQRLKRQHFPALQRGKGGGWLHRLNAQYLYQLPWYMIVGAPGAGKTTALLNSGIEFPLSESMGKTALRGAGGTRHCDWWFTREAVLLDTAGRYALQESQRARDASEWQTFISLLKRYRPRQPINGVIMTISVADLLSDSTEARYAQAHALRDRMAELHQQTGIHFPVYVMVTKTDLLKGFISYFAALDKQHREKMWGFSFPWRNRQPLTSGFEQQFHRLTVQLMADLPARMTRECDLSLRAECFLFPQEFASLQPLLAEYLDTVFSTRDGDLPWSPRGLFFTSGTQEGLPFDRIMGSLTRKLQLPQPHRHTIASWDAVHRQAPIPANKGQSYFIRSLLSDMIFAEASLAGSDSRWELRNRLIHRIGYLTISTVLLIVAAIWGNSFYENQRYLRLVASRLPAAAQQARQLSDNSAATILDLLPFLNSLIALPQSDDFAQDNPPFTLRAGLYRGEQINKAAQGVYQYALKSLLLPRVAQMITTTLRDDNGNDSEFSRNALRAYLMLYQPRSYDGEFLRGWVMQNVQHSLPVGVTTVQMQQLDWHLSQLLDRQIQISPFARDNALVVKKLSIKADQLPVTGQ